MFKLGVGEEETGSELQDGKSNPHQQGESYLRTVLNCMWKIMEQYKHIPTNSLEQLHQQSDERGALDFGARDYG